MRYTLRFINAQSLAQFIVEFLNNTRLQFEVEETVNDEFVVTIFR